MDKKSKSIINCHIHDYFEAACVKKSRLRLRLRSGDVVEGRAEDILIRNKQEVLVLRQEKNVVLGRPEIPLTEILTLEFLGEHLFQVNKIELY